MKNENKPLAKVFHAEIQGKRNDKYEYLLNNSIASVQWQQLDYKAPYHFFVPKDFNEEKEYELGFKVDELFNDKISGVETVRDSITIHFDELSLKTTLNDFEILEKSEIEEKYNTTDARDWQILRAKEDVKKNMNVDSIVNINYRYFDLRKTFYSGKQNGFICNGRYNVQKHLLKENLAIVLPRLCKGLGGFQHGMVSKYIVDRAFGDAFSGAGTNVFPLYLYPDAEKDGMYANAERTPNLNMEIVNKIAEGLGLEFVPEKLDTVGTGRDLSLQNGNSSVPTTFAPIDILDYIYAVLHSPTYREIYKEFLKIDFPRVPYPSDKGQFWKLVKLGGEIRQIHLLESPIVEDFITEYPEDGTNEVEKIKYEGSRVYINSTQYFDNVPEVAWNFYIGGYQPAQKWLKDRKGRVLNFDDILHYQKIIVALTETDRLMKEVDEVMKVEGE